MNFCIRIILFLLFTLTALISGAQTLAENNSPASVLYKLTLQNKFKSADSIIVKYNKSNSHDLGFQLAAINFYWWKYISSGSQEEQKEKIKAIDERIKVIEGLYRSKDNKTLRESELHSLFIMVSSYAFNARVLLAEESYGKVLSLLSRYKPIVKNSLGKEESYAPLYLTSGLYYYVSSQATGKIPLLPYITGYKTEYAKIKGMLYLRKASLLNDPLIRTEARYFLMKIRTELEPEVNEAELYCKLLNKEYPENFLFNYYQIKILIDKGNYKVALDLEKQFERRLKLTNQLTDEEKLYYRTLVESEILRIYQI